MVQLRREKSYPIIRDLESWCKEEYAQTERGSTIDLAMSYLYVNLEQLSGYVNDARFHIDTTAMECSCQPLLINRKTSFFSNSDDSVYATVLFFTLLGCCREHEVNPTQWLEDVLIKVQDKELERTNDYSSLLPFNWKKNN